MIVDIYFKKLNAVLEEIDLESINNAISLIKNKIDNNKKIITCGNGGSAHTASHYITDWNKSFYLSKGIQFKGLSLCDNLGLVTAYANDISYEEIFGDFVVVLDHRWLAIAVKPSPNLPIPRIETEGR